MSVLVPVLVTSCT